MHTVGGGGEPALPSGRLGERPRVASRRRRVTGFTVTAVGLPLLTAALMPFRGGLAEGSLLLVYLLAVVGVAVLGGLVPALTAAAASFLLVNWFLTPPYYTLTVASSDAAVDLVVFVAVAVVVSVTVDLGARHREAAERNRFESRLVSELGSAEISGVSLAAVLERVRLLFDMTTVALLDPAEESGRPLAFVGPEPTGRPSLVAVSVNGLRSHFGKVRKVPRHDECEIIGGSRKHRYLLPLTPEMKSIVVRMKKPYPRRAVSKEALHLDTIQEGMG